MSDRVDAKPDCTFGAVWSCINSVRRDIECLTENVKG